MLNPSASALARKSFFILPILAIIVQLGSCADGSKFIFFMFYFPQCLSHCVYKRMTVNNIHIGIRISYITNKADCLGRFVGGIKVSNNFCFTRLRS